MNGLRRELRLATWRKSSHSGSGDQCVEVAALPAGRCALRDSKDPYGPALVVSARQWRALLTAVGGDR
jgi:hypothetical protein